MINQENIVPFAVVLCIVSWTALKLLFWVIRIPARKRAREWRKAQSIAYHRKIADDCAAFDTACEEFCRRVA